MNSKKKIEQSTLSKKLISTLAGSIAIVSSSQGSYATDLKPYIIDPATISSKRNLKPKLVLKLNMNDPTKSITTLHTSHASHASHASSSPSYTPTADPAPTTYTPAAPTYTPPPVTVPDYKVSPSPVRVDSLSTSNNIISTTQRVLSKGMVGDDVKHMQQYLNDKGYTLPVNGYFGTKTELAVRKFQKKNDLPIDGKAGSLTLAIIEGN